MVAANRLLTRRRLVLAKIESTYGVDAIPSGLTNAILIKNLNITPMEATLVARDLVRPFLGNFENLVADAHVKVDFEVEVAGAGAAGTAPGYGVLLRGCGFAETLTVGQDATYTPVSASIESLTLYFQQDGAQHSITGARGDMEITLQAKAIPTFKFTFTGIYNPPTATSLATPTFAGFQTPLVANSSNTPAFTVGGYAPVLDQFSLKLGNQVDFRSLIGAQYTQILDRKVAGQLSFEAVTPDIHDFFAPALSGAKSAVSLTHGTAAGNIVKLDMPSVNLQNPTYTDNNGVQMMQIPYAGIPIVGNDELTITVK
jgi:hypothetical protein